MDGMDNAPKSIQQKIRNISSKILKFFEKINTVYGVAALIVTSIPVAGLMIAPLFQDNVSLSRQVKEFISAIGVVVIPAGWLVALAFGFMFHHQRHLKRDEKKKNENQEKILKITQEENEKIKLEMRDFSIMNDKFKECSKIINDNAHWNAKGDLQVFNSLIDLFTDQEISTSNAFLTAATKDIEANTSRLLNDAVNVLHAMSGNLTALCIVVANFDDIKDITSKNQLNSLSMTVFKRDDKSHIGRAKYNGMERRVRDNTAYKKIVLEGARLFSSDNLLEMSKSGEYHNSRENWYCNYNAACIVPIKTLAPDIKMFDIIGLLCADNKYGGLSNDKCYLYMENLSWKISVVMEQYRRLGRLINSATENTQKKTNYYRTRNKPTNKM